MARMTKEAGARRAKKCSSRREKATTKRYQGILNKYGVTLGCRAAFALTRDSVKNKAKVASQAAKIAAYTGKASRKKWTITQSHVAAANALVNGNRLRIYRKKRTA